MRQNASFARIVQVNRVYCSEGRMDLFDFLWTFTLKSVGIGMLMLASWIAIAVFMGPTDFAVNLSIGIAIIGFLVILWIEIRTVQAKKRKENEE